MDCDTRIKTTYVGDIPLVNPNTLPDYFLIESDFDDEATGNKVRQLQRMPANRVIGTGKRDGVITIESNNTELKFTAGQPIPARIRVDGSVVSVQRATGASTVEFFVVGSPATGLVDIQNSGFMIFPEGHEYIVGAKYYLDTATGEPTTDNTTGEFLFVPISDTTIAIMLGR